jgi:hypothetical protein
MKQNECFLSFIFESKIYTTLRYMADRQFKETNKKVETRKPL